jgi:ribosomal protein S27AE
MSKVCPGSDIAITIKICPKCGEEVELFTGDSKAKCIKCGTLVRREVASCIDWCPAAKECYSHVFQEEKEEKAKK